MSKLNLGNKPTEATIEIKMGPIRMLPGRPVFEKDEKTGEEKETGKYFQGLQVLGHSFTIVWTEQLEEESEVDEIIFVGAYRGGKEKFLKPTDIKEIRHKGKTVWPAAKLGKGENEK